MNRYIYRFPPKRHERVPASSFIWPFLISAERETFNNPLPHCGQMQRRDNSAQPLQMFWLEGRRAASAPGHFADVSGRNG